MHGAQREKGEGPQGRVRVEPVARFERRLGSAIGFAERRRIFAQLLAGRGELGKVRLLRHLPPQAQRDLGYAEIVLETVIENAERGLQVRRREQRERGTVQLLADRVVLAPELDELLELGLELFVLLAQRDDLALGDGNGASSVRMRHE